MTYASPDTEKIKIIRLEETGSTNDFLKTYAGEEGMMMTVVVADYQHAGRGQGGNSWNSEAGKNLLFSIKTYPERVPVNRQYVMLEAKALAMKKTLDSLLEEVSIKWPNDIYFRDSKIGGTISECLISGEKIRNCILGTGLNVNQQTFPSGIPNPISIYNIIGVEKDRNSILTDILSNFEIYLDMVNSGKLSQIHSLYSEALYRLHGVHLFKDSKGNFLAGIDHVEPDGHIILRRLGGKHSRYAFKEVTFVT